MRSALSGPVLVLVSLPKIMYGVQTTAGQRRSASATSSPTRSSPKPSSCSTRRARSSRRSSDLESSARPRVLGAFGARSTTSCGNEEQARCRRAASGGREGLDGCVCLYDTCIFPLTASFGVLLSCERRECTTLHSHPRRPLATRSSVSFPSAPTRRPRLPPRTTQARARRASRACTWSGGRR